MPTESVPGQPPDRPVIQPTQVIQRERRPLEVFAELFRRPEGQGAPISEAYPPGAEDETRELPPVGPPEHSVAGFLRRPALRLASALAVAGAAGFAAALLISPTTSATPANTAVRTPAAPAPAVSAAPSDPDGAGVLRQGDSGPAVTDLQERLLRIPNVYQGGAVNGRYDATLAAAVARFQVWYGIRGDAYGVYGEYTRRDLESRT